jgi:hypothetical protein
MSALCADKDEPLSKTGNRGTGRNLYRFAMTYLDQLLEQLLGYHRLSSLENR